MSPPRPPAGFMSTAVAGLVSPALVSEARESALQEGGRRGAALMIAALGAVARSHGSWWVTSIVSLAVEDVQRADAVGAIVAEHAADPSPAALGRCAAAMVAWARETGRPR